MTTSQPRNVAASVHHRLVSLAHERRAESQNLLTRYALERLLFRMFWPASGPWQPPV